ncbi:hypothetical protein HETIRDRAFT_120417 [Heterobasidion irregulare TC 32-1]|uniref:Uncharacterized protein n=1 Tax=Heterobasidion irregulare (strain TC 32-1) TaxID=747525 RepID=W4JPV0_HETIT|nr:uncharacterized protein HETIRDRAFT_120417 [Heterobasidion irregulare TC 32-1]ETW75110.1 hypothetical protein HETIRDRAFT_120417 [Heterobasidion irregulare TC 32-1]
MKPPRSAAQWGSILFLNLDLSDLASARHAAAEFMRKILDDAGTRWSIQHKCTHTVKSEGLIHKVRVVHMSSNGHELLSMPGGTDWTAPRLENEGVAARRRLGLWKLYGMSKLRNVLFSVSPSGTWTYCFESFRFDIRIHTLRDGLDLATF